MPAQTPGFLGHAMLRDEVHVLGPRDPADQPQMMFLACRQQRIRGRFVDANGVESHGADLREIGAQARLFRPGPAQRIRLEWTVSDTPQERFSPVYVTEPRPFRAQSPG